MNSALAGRPTRTAFIHHDDQGHVKALCGPYRDTVQCGLGLGGGYMGRCTCLLKSDLCRLEEAPGCERGNPVLPSLYHPSFNRTDPPVQATILFSVYGTLPHESGLPTGITSGNSKKDRICLKGKEA